MCFTQQPPPVTGCVKVEPRLFEAVDTRTHTLLSRALWVARSSMGSRVARRLPGRHSSVTARPLRWRPGLSVGAGARESRHLGVLKVAGGQRTRWTLRSRGRQQQKETRTSWTRVEPVKKHWSGSSRCSQPAAST